MKRGLLLLSTSIFVVSLVAFSVPAQADAQTGTGNRVSPCDNYGDITGDGLVAKDDADGILGYIVGNNIFSKEQIRRSDVNGDGVVNVLDAQSVLSYAEGKTDTFAVCSQKLSITVLSPSSGLVGTKVTITGSGFLVGEKNTVNFGDVKVTVVANDKQTLPFVVPADRPPLFCTAVFPSTCGPIPIGPGIYDVSVTNANGTSNALKFEVTTSVPVPPIVLPSLTQLSPPSGQVGIPIIVNGSGFTPTDNRINFGSGAITGLRSSDKRTLVFQVPTYIDPLCSFTFPRCLAPSVLVTPGVYYVSVTNTNGTSNVLKFEVTEDTSKKRGVVVLSPNGGEVFKAGETMPIYWSVPKDPVCIGDTSCVTEIPRIDIKLWTYNKPCTGVICPLAPIIYIPPVEIVTDYLGGLPYKWIIPTTVASGQYIIEVTAKKINDVSSDKSDGPLTIVIEKGTNLPPVIDGVKGPTSLNVLKEGTWSVTAHDPEGGILGYSVDWGDERVVFEALSAAPIIEQRATFTHTYARAGSYTVIFTVTDDHNQSARTTITVDVKRSSTNIDPKIISFPSIPEKIRPGKLVTFAWTATDADRDDLSWNVSWGDGTVIVQRCLLPNVSSGRGWAFKAAHAWKAAGSYQVKAIVSDCKGGADIHSFSVVVGGDSVIPTITVISPNGREQWEIGRQYPIQWTSQGNIDQVTISLWKGGRYVKNLIRNLKDNGFAVWTPDLALIQGKDYKIRIAHPGTSVFDESDNYFTILRSSTRECLPDGTLIRSPDDPKVYVIRDCQKKWIRTQQEFQEGGYGWENVQEIADPVFNAYADYLIAQANLLRAINQDKVYRIIEGKKLWIPTQETFQAQNLDWNDVTEAASTEVEAYPTARLIRAKSDKKVYFITDSGFKKWIQTAEIFTSYGGNRWEDIVEVDSEVVASYSEVNLIRLINGSKVYKLEKGIKRWVKTQGAFVRNNFDWNLIVSINQTELNYYTEGAVIN